MKFSTLSLLALGLPFVLSAAGCVDTSRAPEPEPEAAGGQGGGASTGESLSDVCGVPLPMEGPIVQAYVPTWVDVPTYTASMGYDTLTHLAIAFANPNGANGETVFEAEEDIVALITKAQSHGVKVVASIAGAADSAKVRAQIGASAVDAYVDDLDAFVEKYGLDGIDVDIEGNSVDATYAPFVEKLSLRLRPKGKLVTAAVASWYNKDVTDEALFCFDFINVMSYDLLTWGSNGAEASDHASMQAAKDDLRYWSAVRGYPAERVVLGLPFYGYCWGSECARSGSQVRYSSIVRDFPEAAEVDWYEAEGVQLSLNSPKTIEEKTRLAQDYGGVMIWEISQDTSDQALFDALIRGLD